MIGVEILYGINLNRSKAKEWFRLNNQSGYDIYHFGYTVRKRISEFCVQNNTGNK